MADKFSRTVLSNLLRSIAERAEVRASFSGFGGIGGATIGW